MYCCWMYVLYVVCKCNMYTIKCRIKCVYYLINPHWNKLFPIKWVRSQNTEWYINFQSVSSSHFVRKLVLGRECSVVASQNRYLWGEVLFLLFILGLVYVIVFSLWKQNGFYGAAATAVQIGAARCRHLCVIQMCRQQ